MKKFLFAFILLMAAVTLFTGCQRNDREQRPERAVNLPFSAAPDGFVFAYYGTEVVLGMPIEDFLSGLGEPLSIRHEPSCAFDGFDLTYIFHDFVIETFPFGEIYYVSMINFRNDNVATAEGLRIGMTYYDMVDLYGYGYINNHGMHSFHNNGMRLDILIEQGEIITQITYHLNLE